MSLETADVQLVQIVNTAMAEAARKSGANLHCFAGCAICCIGPFPITYLDGWRLRRGLAEAEPAIADGIRARAKQAVHAFGGGVPDLSKHENVPCPVLDPDSGKCLLYEHRPIACRTYGPPTLIDNLRLPPCPLCFKGQDDAVIHAARVPVDPAGMEQDVLDAWQDGGGQIGTTFIALEIK